MVKSTNLTPNVGSWNSTAKERENKKKEESEIKTDRQG